MKVANMTMEQKNPVVMRSAAMNTVVAGVLVYLCE